MPIIDMPATPVAATEVVIERRVGAAGNRGLSPVSVEDKVTFLVEAQGRRFRITANLLVHAVVNENANPPACEKAFIKKGAPKPLGQVRIDQLAIQIVVPHVRSQL